jgi:hypothetical protein
MLDDFSRYIVSNPEEPEPPFTKRLTRLKSSDDEQSRVISN